MKTWTAVLEAMIAHARECAPAECCGLLVGRDDEVLEAVRAGNLSGDPRRFLIDPKDHIALRRSARERGLDVVGFYHSHPHSPPLPSETDRLEASYDDHLYAIVSLASEPPGVRFYRIEDRELVAIEYQSQG